jgi:dTDP-3-amino-3,4,6-trideoxy-alpha-D-glucose transaminase
MRIPFVDLRPALKATRAAWRRNLQDLEEKSTYILGPQVSAFENEFAAALGARFAVGVGSGCGALELSLRLHKITGEGNGVLTTALTAPFTAVAIQAAGASPQFADIDPETLQIDPSDASSRLRPDTAALMPVHLYGQPCDLEPLVALSKKAGIPLIQDACQAHGARSEAQQPLAGYSPLTAYSFYPTKNLGCLGDGGAVVTNDSRRAEKLREMRDGGRRRGGQVSFGPGINSRLDEMQACYLRAFLPKLDEWNRRRAALAHRYDEALRGIPGIRLVRRTAASVHHLYVIRASRRAVLRDHLAAMGIATAIHYPVPLHMHPGFASCGLRRGALPHAEKACREILSLPLGPYLSESAVEEVATAIRQFYTHKGGASVHALRRTPSTRHRRARIHRQ